jgi:2',3'-cyclic-nucleotide 2'-phosphodiesterase (5'-nucleotidase family)
MNRTALALASIAGLAGTALAGAPEVAFWLTVLHNNDGESQIINAGEGREDFGGVARFATLADNLRAEALTTPALPEAAARGSLLINSGDTYLAGPEFNASLNSGVPFFDTLAIELIGYDVAAVGNHELDFGPDVFADHLSGFSAGFGLKYLSANLDYTNEAALAPFVGTRLAKSTVIDVAGVQVGIVGATTESLPFVSTPRDIVVNAVAPAVQAEVDALTGMGVDHVILTSHLQGIDTDIALAGELRGVDAIVAGGGDELLGNAGDLLIPGDTAERPYPEFGTDLDGVQVPVVAGPGDYQYLGRLILGFDADGNLIQVDAGSGPVRVAGGDNPDAVAADPEVQAQVVEPVEAALAAQAANIVATSEVPLDGSRPNIRLVETNLGNLCADSLLWQATQSASAFGVATPDVALQNGGGIRNSNVIPEGPLSELTVFGVLPFANFVGVAEDIPVAQFKEILENAISLQPGNNGRFAQVAGFRYRFDASFPAQVLGENEEVVTPGERVREVVLNDGRVLVQNGEVVESATGVNIASIDFLFNGGDQYPYRGAPFTRVGASYFLALQNYLSDGLSGEVTAAQYPVGGEGRINNTADGSLPLTACNLADNAEPTGMLDMADVSGFVDGFFDQKAFADTAEPFGVFDLRDVNVFIDAFFVSGCD